MSASSKVVLVTGANTGLGLEIVRALAESTHAYEILVGGRSLAKAQAAVQQVQQEQATSASQLSAVQVDIEDDSSIEQCVAHITRTHGRLDALVNNAGTQLDQELAAGRTTMREVWNRSYSVNTTSTQVMTAACVPLLLLSANPYLLFLTSGTASVTETGDKALPIPINHSPAPGWPKTSAAGLPAYRASKVGLNMMAREWMRVLKEDGVKVFCISPGMLATGLGGDHEKLKQSGAEDSALGGRFVKDVLEGKRDEDAGLAVRRAGVQPW